MSENYSYDAFIAYGRQDAEYADKLYLLLTVIGYRVFLDSRTLVPGVKWPEEIKRAQVNSLATVVLISNRTDSAYFEQEEIASAIDLARTQRHRVVPVYLNANAADGATVPYGLKQLQSIFWHESTSLLSVAQKIETALVASKRLEQWQHDIDSCTIVIVTGCHHWPELYDRPAAYELKQEIDRFGFGKTFLGSVVMGDIWFQQQSEITEHPNVISIGAAGINNLTRVILEQATTIQNGDRWSVARSSNRWAIFGDRAEDTRAAVMSFKQHDLLSYLRAVWV